MTMFLESLRAFLKPVLTFLDDDSVSEILINGPEDIWIERRGKLVKTDAKFTVEGLLGAARNVAQFVGRPLNDERVRLDARLPDGSRIHVVLAPIARAGTTLSIRKFFKDKLTVDRLVAFGSLTQPMARFLELCVNVKENMLVAGGTGSGKTTLLNVISSLIPDDERILTIEDSAELQLNKTHLVAFESRPPDKFGKGGVDIGDLLNSALRMRPDRIVVGEVRGGEAFFLIQAMNTGHGGSFSTVHANTPQDTLRRVESLCLMSPIEMPLVAVRAQVASAIQVVVVCERLHDGSRRVTRIAEVLPLSDKGEYRTQDLFAFTPVTKAADGEVLGYHAPTGALPTFLYKARPAGFADIDETFFDPATYGVPPPPVAIFGQEVSLHWAPSLKHREKGLPDPAHFETDLEALEARLKAKAAARPSHGAAPAPPPHTRPAPAAPVTRPVARKVTEPQTMESTMPDSNPGDDNTPPPRKAPKPAPAPYKPAPPVPRVDEPSVQLAESLLGELGLDPETPTAVKLKPNVPPPKVPGKR